MIRIKALNDSTNSDSSDSEINHTTREVEEEKLNELYINALKFASSGSIDQAINLLEQLKNELEADPPKINDLILFNRLKYLTYKNLGLFKDDLDFLIDALEIDESDINLWIIVGRKSRQKSNYILSKHCFETAYKFNPKNYIIIENLIDLYFITNNLFRCVSICFKALDIDPEYLKAKIVLNECIRLMPPILEDIDRNQFEKISSRFGGHDRDFEKEPNISHLIRKSLEPLNNLKLNINLLDENEIIKNHKKRNIVLNIDDMKLSSLEVLGLKINSIYELIVENHLNISSPITLECKANDYNLNQTEILNTVENQIDDGRQTRNLNVYEGKKKQFNNDSVIESGDKRRSSRHRTRGKVSDQLEEDQPVYDRLMDILPIELLKENRLINLENDNFSSNSASINENECSPDQSTRLEAETLNRIILKLEEDCSKRKNLNIFELISKYLIEITLIKNIMIPKTFIDLYKIYREYHPLPSALICEIPKDIDVEMILVCLTANEIEFNPKDALFLKEIISKLSFHLDQNNFRQFIIRLFVLLGIKESNIDYFHYALDFCDIHSEYIQHFDMKNSYEADKNSFILTGGTAIEVIASNKLKINQHYINTLIEMQNVSMTKLSKDQNYIEIIRVFFSKSECDLSDEDKRQLFDAIIQTQMFNECIEFVKDWSNHNEDCLQIIYQCLKSDSKIVLSSKLIKKIVKYASEGDSIYPWLILLYLIKSDQSYDQKNLPKFFTIGHSVLGRKNVCTSHGGEFLFEAQKIFVVNEMEDEALMCFSCLFNFPPRKSQFIDIHTSPVIDLKWEHCADIFECFAPEQMPEFDSRQSGISLETKDFFMKILNLIPDSEKPQRIQSISNYIKKGSTLILEDCPDSNSLTSNLYYLLADYHFKAKDFAAAKYFYINDLSFHVNRFDSWAGLALSINYQVDQMLLEGKDINTAKFHQTAFSTMQCFEQALRLQSDNMKLWIEYGILCYNIASNWSRLMKRIKMFSLNDIEMTNVFYKYEDVLIRTKHCFEKAIQTNIYNEESWLPFYMLGKVAEKSQAELSCILQLYESAYLNLYLDGAIYPKKISYYNPPHLSIESLELHYRVHSVILKYLLNNRKFTARMLRNLKFQLIKYSKSPFVLRKSFSNHSGQSSKKQNGSKNSANQFVNNTEINDQIKDLVSDIIDLVSERQIKFDVNRSRSELITLCIKGIKQCLSRYNAHYKSYFRLAHYYNIIQDFYTAKSILCGGIQNKTNPFLRFDDETEKSCSNPGYINGLFLERKSSNLYNGIWRIPIDEIERAGTFNFHMFRCTNLLISVSALTNDYQLLSSIAIQLYKTPDLDKQYINHAERTLLSQKAFEDCFEILEKLLLISPSNTLIEEIQSVAQTMIKQNIYTAEILQRCERFNNQLQANQRM